MSSWLSENLNEREQVAEGPARLNGYSLKSTGVKDRYVGFWDGERIKPLIVVPAGEEVSLIGLNEPFPEGLAVESMQGDGTLIANVFFEAQGHAVESDADGD
jgi:hypothetical protein